MALDLSALVIAPCIAAFGEKALGNPVPTYVQGGSDPFALDGIFDDGWHEVDLLPGAMPVTSSQPTFGYRAADLPAGITSAQGDLITIRGQLYQVKEPRPDSHGGVRLMLNEAVMGTLPAPPAPGVSAGIIVGDYTIFEDTGGNLMIRAPDGTIIPLVRST